MLETGSYDGRGIHGVYATPAAAMAAWSPTPHAASAPFGGLVNRYDAATGEAELLTHPATRQSSYTWRPDKTPGSWTFDADWEHAAAITEHEVQR